MMKGVEHSSSSSSRSKLHAFLPNSVNVSKEVASSTGQTDESHFDMSLSDNSEAN